MSDPDFEDPFADDLLAGLGGAVGEVPSRPAHDAHEASSRLRDRMSAKVVRSESARQWTPGNTLAMIALIIMAFCCGGWIFHGTPSPTRDTGGSSVSIDPGPTKTATVRATVTVASVPESCQAAMQYTQEILPYIGKIVDASSPAIEAIQNAYVAISNKDYKAINAAQTQIHKVEVSLTDPAAEYNQLLKDATTSMAACLDELNGR